MSTTIKLLIAEYGTAEIPLDAICERYMGLSLKVAKERAAGCALPIPAYRTAPKAPWHVRASDLAALIDTQAEQARERWQMVRGAA